MAPVSYTHLDVYKRQVQYYLTSIPDNTATAAVNDATGLLFFDANSDGAVDGVVVMTGISSANFALTDIIIA